MKIGITSFIFLLISAANIFAADLCKDIKVEAPEELIMKESEFTFEEANQALEILRKRMYGLLEEKKLSKDILESPQFYITYPNSLTIIEGTLLKQKVLLARKEYELLKQKGKVRESKRAEKIFIRAKEDFCKFLSKTIYVD